MDAQSAGYGAGGGVIAGFIVALVSAFGFGKRLDKLESGVIWKDTCAVCKQAHETRLERIEDKLDKVLEKL